MTCLEAAEFVSALCDGEIISRDAAEHIGDCDVCRVRLREYVSMGAELRRVASLSFAEETKPRLWEKRSGLLKNLWEKGWEAMRIPRLAFGAMVVGLLTVTSSLIGVSARARDTDNVVLLKVSMPGGNFVRCALSTVDKKSTDCSYLGVVSSGSLIYQIHLLSRNGESVELGVKAKFTPLALAPGVSHTTTMSLNEFAVLPEQHYSFKPGETLQIDIPGFGNLPVTGEWTDHTPSLSIEKHDLDPEANQLRIVSPVLLCGQAVVGDMEGGTTIVDDGRGVAIYLPGQGRFQFSLAHVDGAVEGVATLNRIKFEIDGQRYTLLSAAPITRGNRVWVLRDRHFQPAEDSDGKEGFIGSVEVQSATGESAKD